MAHALDVEMLQGMAPAQAQAVRADVGPVLLYTPVVAPGDFDVAVGYLVRRLEESAAPQNYLHALFAPRASRADALAVQESQFRAAWRDRDVPATAPRRRARPLVDDLPPGRPAFANTPDTDPSVAPARGWARDLTVREVAVPAGAVEARTRAEVDALVARALRVQGRWAATSPADRARVLRQAARRLQDARGDLVATMVRETGKTVAEADPEVSEAVDLARYYAERADDLADGAVPGAVHRPAGTTVVTPPWNFPVAIPTGSVLAALAAGSPVLVKPAPQAPRCTRVTMAAVAAALDDCGALPDVLTVVLADEATCGRRLVTHPGVARVLLTGSIQTARLFAEWRPERDVIAETSGKNAIVVTPSADLDLAVADVVRSAFGNAGQKCSAASLLVLVGSVGRSDRFRRQLADAVTSLRVGPGEDLSVGMGPLVEPAAGPLLRALTTLDPGERWLVAPRRLDADGRLWSPGVRYGVRRGSWLHQTECFGPVLGVMRVRTLDEALDVQDAVPFGLTGGLHSLDDDEIDHWLERVQVGNADVNRHITGAVVRRQPFGGWKASTVGPGAKAGGPHYVAQIGTWSDAPDVPQDDDAWLAWAQDDDDRAWREVFSREHDPSRLQVGRNVLRYRPVPGLLLRVGDGARGRDVARVRHAARTAQVAVEVSDARDVPHEAFASQVRSGAVRGRVRVVGRAPGLRAAAAERTGLVTVLDGPVLASAERELLTVLREQTVSRTAHRFGHVTER